MIGIRRDGEGIVAAWSAPPARLAFPWASVVWSFRGYHDLYGQADVAGWVELTLSLQQASRCVTMPWAAGSR